MALLPYFQSENSVLNLLQTKWRSLINPVLTSLTNQSVLVENVSLINGVTVVNHGLGRTPVGWIVTDLNSVASIYRSAEFNNLTLTLTSSAVVTVSLEIF